MTSFSAGVENLQNYVYFNNDALPAQESGSVQVLSLRLKQDLHFRAFNWENSVTYQTSSKEEVLSLPKLAVYSNLYFQFKIARVLHVNLGVDCTTIHATTLRLTNQPQWRSTLSMRNSSATIR